MSTSLVNPAGTHPYASPVPEHCTHISDRQIHLVIITEDDEIRDVWAFATSAGALACRDTFVRDRWDDCFNDEPIPTDSDEAFELFEDEACYHHGVFIRLVAVKIAP